MDLTHHQEREGVYYGWYIVTVAFVANFMAVGTGFYYLNALMEPLSALRGWSRTEINLALTFGTGIGFGAQLLYGTLVMRVGPRVLMLTGALLSGAAFVAVGRAEHLWVFYLLYMIFFLGNRAYGGIVANTAVNNWFENRRGAAIGIATSGMSMAGAVLPFCAMLLIHHTSIPFAFLVMGISILAVAPLVWWVVRDQPSSLGLAPYGLGPRRVVHVREVAWGQQPGMIQPGAGVLAAGERNMDVWPFSDLVRDGAFWKMGIGYGLMLCGVVGVMSQLKPRFSDIGFGANEAMAMMSFTALLAAVGKYAWGVLCDRFEPRLVVLIMCLAKAGGLVLGLGHGSVWLLFPFMILFGFAAGGVLSTYPIMVADLYGREVFASVLRFISLLLVLQLMGYVIAGQSFDRTGSYDLAYLIFAVLDVAAAGLIFSIKRPSRI